VFRRLPGALVVERRRQDGNRLFICEARVSGPLLLLLGDLNTISRVMVYFPVSNAPLVELPYCGKVPHTNRLQAHPLLNSVIFECNDVV